MKSSFRLTPVLKRSGTTPNHRSTNLARCVMRWFCLIHLVLWGSLIWRGSQLMLLRSSRIKWYNSIRYRGLRDFGFSLFHTILTTSFGWICFTQSVWVSTSYSILMETQTLRRFLLQNPTTLETVSNTKLLFSLQKFSWPSIAWTRFTSMAIWAPITFSLAFQKLVLEPSKLL